MARESDIVARESAREALRGGTGTTAGTSAPDTAENRGVCPGCGASIDDDAWSCHACGAPVVSKSPPRAKHRSSHSSQAPHAPHNGSPSVVPSVDDGIHGRPPIVISRATAAAGAVLITLLLILAYALGAASR